MLQPNISLFFTISFCILSNFALNAKTVEVHFESDLVSTRFAREVPKVTGSFQYDDSEVHSGNGLYHYIDFVEIKDFTISAQGSSTNFENGVFYTITPRFPDLQLFDFHGGGFAIGELDFMHSDSPFLQEEQEEEIYSIIGLDPDGEISDADFDALDDNQQSLAVSFWTVGMPRVSKPLVDVTLRDTSLSVVDVLQSSFPDNYLSSWQYYMDVPCNNAGPVLYVPGMGSGQDVQYCRELMMEYEFVETSTFQIVPESSSITLLIAGTLFLTRRNYSL